MLLKKSTAQCIDFLKSQTSEVILFYSGGKDSLILLDILTKHFKVHLAFMYFVPDLEHIERYLDFAVKKYGVDVKKYPHFMISDYMNDNYYRFHEEEVPKIKLADIQEKARKDFNCDWIVSGIKKNDSLNRRLMLKGYFMESIYLKGRMAYPLTDWTKADCYNYIKMHKMPQPVAYNKKNSSGADLNRDFLLYCKEKHPNDYKKILDVFPFAETILLEQQD